MQEVERLCDRVVLIAHGPHGGRGSVAELCERTGRADFEEAFVELAYGPGAGTP
jgi:sodium transport system ATP-binding protein